MTPLSNKPPFSTCCIVFNEGSKGSRPDAKDLNPYVEEYAGGENDRGENSDRKSLVRLFIRVLPASVDHLKFFLYSTWIGLQVSSSLPITTVSQVTSTRLMLAASKWAAISSASVVLGL